MRTELKIQRDEISEKFQKLTTYTISNAMGKEAISHIADRNAKYIINPSGEESGTTNQKSNCL